MTRTVLDKELQGLGAQMIRLGSLVDTALAQASSDLVAMATHGYRGFQRWTLGSVTERVLQATRLPLLNVRPAE